MVENSINKIGILSFENEVERVIFCKEDIKKAKRLFLENISQDEKNAEIFFKKLEKVILYLEDDLNFFLESDPASDSIEEIIACYPGFKAIVYYRIAHILAELNLRFEARILTEHAHFLTGIDIHPAASIGHPFFIDHGTGIVIGETTVIGNKCKIYQGVTLGALSLKKGRAIKGVKRHPTIGNNVTIYANASILGGEVIIGNNVVIGSNVFLLESVPDNTKVVIQKPELIVIKK